MEIIIAIIIIVAAFGGGWSVAKKFNRPRTNAYQLSIGAYCSSCDHLIELMKEETRGMAGIEEILKKDTLLEIEAVTCSECGNKQLLN